MHDAGRMYEYGSITCPKTGRTVRVNGLRGVHDIGSYT
jgi:glutathionyl-hydroquinone reductase